jgi:NCAIR mutase (PurE)-related protein
MRNHYQKISIPILNILYNLAVTIMDIKDLLRKYREGECSEDDLLRQLRLDHLESIEGRLNYDLARESRAGFPEAILAISKTPEDIAGILRSVLPKKGKIFVTKLTTEKMGAVEEILGNVSDLGEGAALEYHPDPNLLVAKTRDAPKIQLDCTIGVVAGGTSDIPIAEEARIIAAESGLAVVKAYDVGVAGLHRVFPPLKEMILRDVDLLIVVAGMEGALPSVVKGLIDVPVIGVPTSVGYGYRGGESALIAMLNSCVPGLLVTNIDNGFGAAAAAHAICSRIVKKRRE